MEWRDMAWRKLRLVLDFVHAQGRLPRDEKGNVLDGDSMLAWYGLARHLSSEEQQIVKKELAAMADAEDFMNRVRLNLR